MNRLRNKVICFLVLCVGCAQLAPNLELKYPDPNPYVAHGRKFALATQGPLSAQAGQKMLEAGGNAVDAGVAISFALAVERPQSTGLGGGGFFVLNIPGQGVKSLDFREKAPATASKNMYLDSAGEVIPNASLVGEKASGVPGMVSGLYEIHKKYGKLPWATVLAPAQQIAQDGFIVYSELAKALDEKKDVLKSFPGSFKIFFNGQGEILKEGDLLRQQDLAQTIGEIAKHGAQAFYEGQIAHKIAQQYSHTGYIKLKDLSEYRPTWRAPVSQKLGARVIYSMGPPSSGGIHVLQILKMLDSFPLQQWGPDNWRSIHITAQAMQQAFADRAEYLGDADFVSVPVKGLLNDSYLKGLTNKFDLDRAKVQKQVPAGSPLPYESSETAHFSVMDSQGWAIASTQTVNGFFGSGMVVEGTGMLMNNEMDDFSVKPGAPNLFGAIGGEKNSIAPGKRPLSSMSPTLVLENGRPIMAIGSPSGTKIITCVAQVLLNRLVYGMSLEKAMAYPRYHHQWSPDVLRVEEPFFPGPTLSKLSRMGYTLEKKALGCRVQAVELSETGELTAVADLRGLGKAIGE